MVYVKLVRKSWEKTMCEMLNIKSGICGGEVTDTLLLCNEYGSEQRGYIITQEDLQMLYNRKKEEYAKIADKYKSDKEKKIDEQLKELAEIKRKEEEKRKKFPWCISRMFQ